MESPVVLNARLDIANEQLKLADRAVALIHKAYGGSGVSYAVLFTALERYEKARKAGNGTKLLTQGE